MPSEFADTSNAIVKCKSCLEACHVINLDVAIIMYNI